MDNSLPYFTETPKLSYAHEESKILKRNLWLVNNDFTFVYGTGADQITVHVHKGYLTDLASVPRLFWSVFPPFGGYVEAAIVHDWLCEYCLIEKMGVQLSIDRKQADDIFKTIMTHHKVSWLNKNILYGFVRLWAIATRVNGPRLDKEKQALEKTYIC